MEQVDAIKTRLNEKLSKYEKLNDLERQTGLEKAYMAVIAGVLSSLIVYFIGGPSLIVNLIGFVYPAYQSFKAINAPQKDDDAQWLTYWILYSIFDLSEQTTDLFVCWIPMYYLLKLAFLVYAFLPKTKGALVIYVTVLQPRLAPLLTQQPAKKLE